MRLRGRGFEIRRSAVDLPIAGALSGAPVGRGWGARGTGTVTRQTRVARVRKLRPIRIGARQAYGMQPPLIQHSHKICIHL